LRPRWRSKGRRRPLAHPQKGAGQPRQVFLVTARNGGAADRGRKSNDAVAPKRSKRNALFFGQIRPVKRPFGAVETRGPNGDDGAPEAPQDDQTGNHRPMSPLPQALPVSFTLPTLHRHCPCRVQRTGCAWCRCLSCAFVPGQCPHLTPIRTWRADPADIPTGTADCLCSLLILSNAPCGTNMQETFVRMVGYHMPILHGKAFVPSGSAPAIRSLLSVRCGRSVSARSRGKTDVEGGLRTFTAQCIHDRSA